MASSASTDVDFVESSGLNTDMLAEYNNSNPDNVSGTYTRTLIDIIKNTVMQKLFGYNDNKSHILDPLKEKYNCQISYSYKDGKYAFFIRPNDTNYMIHTTHSIKDGKSRIFFNITRNNKEPKAKINTEYICCYIIENNNIIHQYNMNGVPSTISKKTIDINAIKVFFNPYLELNKLITKFIGPKIEYRVTMDDNIELINERIDRLSSILQLNDDEKKKLDKIKKDYLGTSEKKLKIDSKIIQNYRLAKKFIPKSLGQKGPEDIESTVTITKEYRTNNEFTEKLAYRYASYIPGFPFTKSAKDGVEWTDPFNFKLETPFTATDIYLHRFERHLDYEYGMDRYNIYDPASFIRLADIVELSKSLMMNFINISYYLSSFKDNETKTVGIELHNIYQGLLWNKGSIPIYRGYFDVLKRANGLTINISTNTSINTSAPIIPPIVASEIPFIDIVPPVNPNAVKTNFKKQPIINSVENIRNIVLVGVEQKFFDKPFDDISMDRLYNMYYDVKR